MAPEQLEGKEADARTDIFAFGCVLYEMATGKKAFSGASQASLISSIMKEEPPPISTVAPMTPPALDRVVKTLPREGPGGPLAERGGPEERAQVDRRGRLGERRSGSGRGRIRAPAPRLGAWAAALLLAVLGFAAGRLLQRPAEAPVTRSSIDLPAQMDLERWSSIALSPDGSMLTFAATGADGKREIWIRRLDGFAVQALAGTENGFMPFWSPDNRSIGFFADRKLKRVPAGGGPVLTICDAQDGRGGSWSEDDMIVFAPAPFTGLSKVSAAGGVPEVLTKVDHPGATHRLPWFLPGGKRLLYLSGAQTSDTKKDTLILALDLASGKSTPVAHENSEGRFVQPGYLAFVRDGNLLLQAFDPSTLKLSGAPIPVAEGVAFEAFRWVGNFTFSNTGRLVFQSNEAIRRSRLTWFDLDGKELGQVGEAASFFTVAISPDSRRVAATVLASRGSRPEVRLYDLERGVGTRFSFGDQGANFPIWSLDGREIAFGDPGSGSSDQARRRKLRRADRLETGHQRLAARLVARREADAAAHPGSLGRRGGPLRLPPRWRVQTAQAVRDGPERIRQRRDLARRQVAHVRVERDGAPGDLHRALSALGERRQVSTSGGTSARWLGNRSLLYVQPSDGKFFAVDFDENGDALRMGAPRPVFGNKVPPRGPFGVTSDGKRLLFAVPIDDSSSAQIRFISDWRVELAKRR